jgi:hypothetical protein
MSKLDSNFVVREHARFGSCWLRPCRPPFGIPRMLLLERQPPPRQALKNARKSCGSETGSPFRQSSCGQCQAAPEIYRPRFMGVSFGQPMIVSQEPVNVI